MFNSVNHIYAFTTKCVIEVNTKTHYNDNTVDLITQSKSLNINKP